MLSPIKDFLRLRRGRSTPSFRMDIESVPDFLEGERAVITYTSAVNKLKAYAALTRYGIEKGDQVYYTYPEEESETVRAKLEESGIDVEKYEKNGTLLLRSLTERYIADAKFDKERAIREGLEERGRSKEKGYKHFRDLEDVGDFSFLKGQWQTYMDYWDDPRWGVPTGSGVGLVYEPFIIELTMVDVGGMSETVARDILKAFGGGKFPPTMIIDMLEYIDAFSKILGISHQKLLSSKLLMEFDPVSDYERIVGNFAKEALACFEPTYIFTPSNSAVHAALAKQRTIKFFLMSVSPSNLKSISENEIIMPADNTSLTLDSLNEILKKYTEENVFLVFDDLSELITLVGFEKAYKFLLYVIEMLSSKRTTALFLLNSSAQKPEAVSRIRGLFDNLLTYQQDRLNVVKSSLTS